MDSHYFAIMLILGIDQLYLRGMLFTSNGNNYVDALNQVLIFSPTILLVLIRKQSMHSIWLPKSNILTRIILGFSMGIISLFIGLLEMMPRV